MTNITQEISGYFIDFIIDEQCDWVFRYLFRKCLNILATSVLELRFRDIEGRLDYIVRLVRFDLGRRTSGTYMATHHPYDDDRERPMVDTKRVVLTKVNLWCHLQL